MKLIDLNQTKKRHLIFDKPGRWRVVFKNLSGKLTFEIRQPGVNLKIEGIYQGKGKERFSLQTKQHHLAPDSQSNLIIKGVFDNQAQFAYQGLVRIEKEAKNTQAQQKNQNLVLSPDCSIDSQPFLEILNNQVTCAHAVNTAPPNKEELFFLKNRGLTEKKAKKLIVKGFLEK